MEGSGSCPRPAGPGPPESLASVCPAHPGGPVCRSFPGTSVTKTPGHVQPLPAVSPQEAQAELTPRGPGVMPLGPSAQQCWSAWTRVGGGR